MMVGLEASSRKAASVVTNVTTHESRETFDTL